MSEIYYVYKDDSNLDWEIEEQLFDCFFWSTIAPAIDKHNEENDRNKD